MHLIRQSTASTVTVGPVLDSTGTAVTSAVVGDFRISKNGSTATLSGATVTHDANGYYNIALTAGNTDTAGRLVIYSGNTAQSMGAHRFTVLLPSVFDALIANATNSTGGLATATAAISAFAGAISTFNSATNTVTLAAATHTGAVIPTVTSLTNSVTVGGYAAGQAPLQPTVANRTLDVTATGAAGIDWGNVENQNANVNLSVTFVNQVGEVVGSVGEISGVTFPNHFDNLAIAPNGHVTATVDAINNNAITAASIQADAITSAKIATGAITSAAFAADSITATALATSAVNEIKDAVAAIAPISDLATMIVNDGTANARYSVSALQNGPSGEGGSVINVYPVSASTPERVAGTTITFYRNENRSVSVVTDFTLTALTLRFVVEDLDGNDIEVIDDGSISRSDKTFTVTIGTDVTATLANYRWALRDVTGGSDSVIARGVLSVQEAASNA